jgi:hypothetical protein
VKHKEKRRAMREKRMEKDKAYRQIYDALNRGKLLAGECRRRCARKNLPCDLENHLPELEKRVQSGRCEMTGVPFDFHAKGTAWNSPSLHRIVPAKGYTFSNIKVICFAMNAALGNWGEEPLKKIATEWLRKT